MEITVFSVENDFQKYTKKSSVDANIKNKILERSNSECSDEKQWRKFWTCCKGDSRRKCPFSVKPQIAMVLLATANFMSSCSMSIMAPFYPAEAAKKGVTESMAGLVFGFYALVIFITSTIFGKLIPKVGAKFLFVNGLLVSGIAIIFFGTLYKIEDRTVFTTTSLVIRGIEGLGTSAYSTAAFVIIMTLFPDNAGAVRGVQEIFVGLGMSAGPGIGGLLYAMGGFSLPFFAMGTVIIVLVPLNIYLLPNVEELRVERDTSLLSLLKMPSVLVTCLVIIISSLTWAFLDPTLEPHLRKFNLSPQTIGVMFLILSATYGSSCPIWGYLTDKVEHYWWLMPLGLVCTSIAQLLLGPSPILFFLEDSIQLNIVALSLLGIFVAMSLMPTYQLLLDITLQHGFKDNLPTNSIIAGLWSSVYSLGEVIGPVLGGILVQTFDFPVTSTIFAALNFITGIIVIVYFTSISKKSESSNLNKETSETVIASYRSFETSDMEIKDLKRSYFKNTI